MKALNLIITCLLISSVAWAQDAPVSAGSAVASVTKPAKRVLYFGKRGSLVSNPDSADHREELIYRDSVGGTARIYYPSGKLRRMVPYLHFERDIRYGIELSFYETGEIRSRREIKLNEPVGESLTYYRNGTIRSRIVHDSKDKSKQQITYYTESGAPRPAPGPEAEKMPALGTGGYDEIVAAIQRHVRYPSAALRGRIQGKVFVEFTVDDMGYIRYVHITKSPSPILSEAVLQAVAALERLTPAEQEGYPTEIKMTMPVTFAVD